MSFVALVIGITSAVAIAKGRSKKSNAAKVALRLYEKYKGQIETDKSFQPFLKAVWKNVGLSDKAADNYIKEKQPWSAAFISTVMLNAGFKDFPVSASHSCYNEQARINRENKKGKFHLYKIDEYKPQVGDIVSKGRAGVTLKYETVKCGQLSHSDIVVKVLPNEIWTIGGNVANAISITKVPTKNGFINKDGYYAIIKNLH